MPCCIAKLNYRGCLHTTWIKLGCSVSCRTGCHPASTRFIALHAEYLWACADCRLAAHQEEEALRVEEYSDYLGRLKSNAECPAAWREGRTACVRYRAAREKQLDNKREAVASQEVIRAARWVFKYGIVLGHAILADKAGNEKAKAYWIGKAKELFACKSWDMLIKTNTLNSEDELRDMQPLPTCIARDVKKRRVAATAGRRKRIKMHRERRMRRLPAVPLFCEATQHTNTQQASTDPELDDDVASDVAEIDSDEERDEHVPTPFKLVDVSSEPKRGCIGELPFEDLKLEDHTNENLISDVEHSLFDKFLKLPSPSP